MTTDNINIDKSIEEGKLILKGEKGISKFLERSFVPIHIIGLALIPATDIYYSYQKDASLGNDPYYLTILLGLLVFVWYLGDRTYDLKRISGHSKNLNREIIESYVEERKWKVADSNDNATVVNIEWEQTSHDIGKKLTIIYDHNDLLINCRSYLLHFMTSPFHRIANNRIIDSIKNQIKN